MENQESVVKIMVESPKDPPNVEFGVAFPRPTAIVRQKTDPTAHEIEIETDTDTVAKTETIIESEIAGCQMTDTSISTSTPDANRMENVIVPDPIDVNTPRDTTNIFYAYEDVEFDNSLQPQSSIDGETPPEMNPMNIESDNYVVNDQNNTQNIDDQTYRSNNQNNQSNS